MEEYRVYWGIVDRNTPSARDMTKLAKKPARLMNIPNIKFFGVALREECGGMKIKEPSQ